jgi:DNA polymerase-3 subunit epsilon/ATP-dependent DNA helicase DinG
MNASTNHFVPAGPPSLVRERGVEASEVDPWRLAGLLVPGLGPGERGKLARAFGITLAPSETVDPIARAPESTVIVEACRKHLEGLDLPLLQRLARIFSGSLLPEAGVIDDVFRARARLAFADDGPTAATADVADLPVSGSPLPPPLQATRTRRGVESREVLEAFADDGPLARSLPGYEARPGQLKMSRAVAKALNDRLKLIVEAGTGTGKSLAYLLPAATYAAKNGRRVVVSTNTINLQEQLYFKDIPLLRRAMALPFEATVLKGRANYLCLRRWRSFLREGVQTDADRLLAAKVLLWLTKTETGDRGELALDAREATRWATALAADAQHCTPQLCRDHRVGRCFLSRARRRAEGSHVIVVNHALLLADQALESKILPEYDDLIVDEAHHLEDVATRQLGANIDQQELLTALTMLSQQQGAGRYAGLVTRVQATLIAAAGAPMRNEAGALTQPAHDAAEAARQSVAAFFEAVAAFVAEVASAPGQPRAYGAERSAMAERDLRLTPAVRATGTWPAVELAWDEAAKDLGTLASGLAHIADALEPFEGSAEAVDDALADLATAQRQLGEVLIDLSAIVATPTPDRVYWITGHDRGLTLHAAPLDVGELLEKHLFSQKDCVVLTTATAQVGGSFRYLRERLGLGPGSFTLAVPSPFDYASQALLCVAADLPDPGDRAFGDASHKALHSILEVTGGRTLVLFTSHAALRAAHEYLRPRLRRLTVLGQGLDGGRQQLLERLREAPRTVLLGTSSFWEGIDVVGDALSCLVIVKLPFSVPNDPVFAARSEQFAQPFGEFALPQAVLRLKQGFGRLIRSTRDRGVVVVLDSRLRTKSYGSTFLRSLPPATQHHCSWRELAPLTRSWLAGTAPPLPGQAVSATRGPLRGI